MLRNFLLVFITSLLLSCSSQPGRLDTEICIIDEDLQIVCTDRIGVITYYTMKDRAKFVCMEPKGLREIMRAGNVR